MISGNRAVVIGAGHAGLAVAHALVGHGIEPIVLERGQVAERWRTRWDSLRLLTPNWMTGLPGHSYHGLDPDGFMGRNDVVGLLESYAARSGADVREGVEVTGLRPAADGMLVSTDKGRIYADDVIVATGHAADPHVPRALAEGMSPATYQMHAAEYRRPEDLPDGGVLVVGAGASGLQIGAELCRAGKEVTLAVGRHARAVRRYRGLDMWNWLDQVGSLSTTVDEVADPGAAARSPSLGLTGAEGGVDIDLAHLSDLGARIVGRVVSTSVDEVRFGDNLHDDVDNANRKLNALLDRFDAHAEVDGLDGELPPPYRQRPVRLPDPERRLDLMGEGIATVIWCTGYTRSYPWLELPVLDERGEIIQRRGVTPYPGLYVVGLRFQWTRASHFLGGVAEDATYVARHIAARAGALAAA